MLETLLMRKVGNAVAGFTKRMHAAGLAALVAGITAFSTSACHVEQIRGGVRSYAPYLPPEQQINLANSNLRALLSRLCVSHYVQGSQINCVYKQQVWDTLTGDRGTFIQQEMTLECSQVIEIKGPTRITGNNPNFVGVRFRQRKPCTSRRTSSYNKNMDNPISEGDPSINSDICNYVLGGDKVLPELGDLGEAVFSYCRLMGNNAIKYEGLEGSAGVMPPVVPPGSTSGQMRQERTHSENPFSERTGQEASATCQTACHNITVCCEEGKLDCKGNTYVDCYRACKEQPWPQEKIEHWSKQCD